MKDYVINSPLINEWNWEKNNELGFYPDKITLGSGKKVWWICNDCGLEYVTQVKIEQKVVDARIVEQKELDKLIVKRFIAHSLINHLKA